MSRIWPTAIQLLLLGFLAHDTPALAAPFDGKPKLLLHVSPVIAKNTCAQGVIDCQAAVTAGSFVAGESGPYYNAYILAVKGDLPATSGLSFIMSYGGGNPAADRDGMGIDVFQAVLCEGLCLPIGQVNFGKPEAGCNQYWDSEYTCRSDDVKVSGYFYLGAYSADTLSVRPPNSGVPARILGCPETQEIDLSVGDLGTAIFSAAGQIPGCNPCMVDCAVTPVRAATWSGIKSLIE